MMTAENFAPILRGAMLGALAAVLLLAEPSPGAAQGAGTQYFACRDQAWADYNTCLVGSSSKLGQFACFVAWDLDNVHCDVKLIKDLM
jgi:hypothetical protein